MSLNQRVESRRLPPRLLFSASDRLKYLLVGLRSKRSLQESSEHLVLCVYVTTAYINIGFQRIFSQD